VADIVWRPMEELTPPPLPGQQRRILVALPPRYIKALDYTEPALAVEAHITHLGYINNRRLGYIENAYAWAEWPDAPPEPKKEGA
jgi:hypothetical protein